MRQKSLFLVFFLSIVSLTLAQSKYEIGGIVDVNIRKKINDKWSFSLDPEFREVFYKGTKGNQENSEAVFQNQLVDFTAYLQRDVSALKKWSLGYTFRLRERESFVNRFIQIYQITQVREKYDLTHQFRFDETVANSDDFTVRFHYRYKAKFPIHKKDGDLSKFYYFFQNQFVNTIIGPKYNLEIRWLLALGYNVGPKNNVYAGFDYRVDQFINTNGSSLSRYWFKVSWNVNL